MLHVEVCVEKRSRTATGKLGQVPAHIVFDSLFPATSSVKVVSPKIVFVVLFVVFCFFWADADCIAQG